MIAFAEGLLQQVQEFGAAVLLLCLRLVGVFDVEVVAVGFDAGDVDAPGLLAGLALLPPCFQAIKFDELDGFGFGVGFVACGELVFVVPDVFEVHCLIELNCPEAER